MQAAAKDEDDANACFVYSNLRPKNTRSFMQARSVIKKSFRLRLAMRTYFEKGTRQDRKVLPGYDS